MPITLSSSIPVNLTDLHDVSISNPQNGQYLRFNSSVPIWQNSYISSDIYGYLSTSLTSSDGIILTNLSGPQTVNIGLAQVNPTPGTFGDTTDIPVITTDAQGRITAITTVTLTAGPSSTSDNLANGVAGDIPYQTGPNTTAFLSTNTGVLIGGITPSYSITPSLTGTNFTGIPNAALNNDSLTIGSTSIVLGQTVNNLTGLTSLSATTLIGSLTGNATTSNTLFTPRTISSTGDSIWSVSFDGSSNVSASSALVNVNGAPQSNTFRKVTINAKGLTTSTSSVTPSDIVSALGYLPINSAGDVMTGQLILNADPTVSLGAVTKQYVDNIASGINIKNACMTSSITALNTNTYNNGSGGVGATLIATANGSINGTGIGGDTSLTVGSRVLIKDESTTYKNGIYNVTVLGSGTTPWILTRASDFDGSPTNEVTAGDLTYVQQGTLAGTQWVQTQVGTGSPGGYIIVGTDSIIFSQFTGPGSYTAGTGINIASNTISNIGVTSIVAGTNISISSATGAVTINSTGASTATNIAGGTNGSMPYQTAANVTTMLPPGTNTNVLTLVGGIPTWGPPATSGTVTAVSITTANGISGTVANSTTTPAITLTLGTITPSSVAATGTITGSNLSGTNTGDQIITLTGGVTGSGTGSFATTVVTNANLTGVVTSSGNVTSIANGAISNIMLANSSVANLSGTNTGDQSTITGNSGTTTKLATARSIDGQSFDGTANITVIAPGTHASPSKTTPVDNDEFPLADSAVSYTLAKVTLANLKATLKTYLDTLYATISLVQNIKSSAHTTILSDAGKQIFHPSSDTTARIWTIDSNANVAYPVGTGITFINQHGAGTITISINADIMRLAGSGSTGNRTLVADGIATAIKITSTEWIINGTGLT